MSADTDAITLAIAGHEHRDWERYSIDSDFFTPADAWSLSLGIPATAIPDYVKPWAEVQVRLGTDVILTGRVDAVRRRLAKGEHRLELHGRDRAGVLLDCSAPVLARRELTLAYSPLLMSAARGWAWSIRHVHSSTWDSMKARSTNWTARSTINCC